MRGDARYIYCHLHRGMAHCSVIAGAVFRCKTCGGDIDLGRIRYEHEERKLDARNRFKKPENEAMA